MKVWEAEKLVREIKRAIMFANNNGDFERVQALKEKKRQIIVRIINSKRRLQEEVEPIV